MNGKETALALFKEGFSCSQAIVAAYGGVYGIDRETALRVSAGFGGGMGRMAGTCGAVTGAYMVIGLKHGAMSVKDKERKNTTHRLVREFAERFKAVHGGLSCKELLDCDISTPAGAQRAKENKCHTTLCPKFVASAAEILEVMLKD